jgi:SAM-dependent methyltransferase
MDWAAAYELDEQTGVRTRRDRRAGFEYSDGAESEEHMLRAVLESDDVSSGSDELVARIVDWPSEYHFSAARATLLAPLEPAGLTVLEVGSGCGAITRALGEAGARVVALEASAARARITAARCRGLEAVDVVCDDFLHFEPPADFDVVLLVGVLEYAPLYFGGPDPVGAALAKAIGCLSPRGSVVVAIENQLGLKYFAGRSEDHSGRPFYGIEDRYQDEGGAVTFGRRELSSRLAGAGLPRQTWYFPFPDYKLPRAILTEAALADPGLDAGRLAGDVPSRDYGRPAARLFAEDAAWEVAGRNGLVPDLANSFLVVAARAPGDALTAPPAWLAELRSTDRVRAYRTVTRIVREEQGLVVLKENAPAGVAPPAGAPVEHVVTARSPYLPGVPLARGLRSLLRTPGAGPADLATALSPWRAYLAGHETPGGRGVLPGELLDAVPWNLMTRGGAAGDGGLTPFDQEWLYRGELDLGHVVVRGLSSLLLAAGYDGLPASMGGTLGELIEQVTGAMGLPLDRGSVRRLTALESEIQACVFGMDPEATRERMVGELDAPPPCPPPLSATLQGLEQRSATYAARVAELEDAVRREHAAYEALRRQMAAVEQSTSWRVTAPLRRLRRPGGGGGSGRDARARGQPRSVHVRDHACLAHGPGALHLGVDHHVHELLEGDRGLPAERLARMRRVSARLRDVDGPQEALVDAHVLVVVEPHARERPVAELPHGVALARRDDVVAGLVRLHHQVHGAHVVAGEAPVAARVQVAEHDVVVQAGGDARRGAGDLARDVVGAPVGALVVEEDAVGGVQLVGAPVGADERVGVQLGGRVGVHRAEGGALRLRRLLRLAEQLGRGRLVEPHLLAAPADDLEDAERAERRGLAGVLGQVEADLDVALAGEVVHLVGVGLVHEEREARGVGELRVVQVDAPGKRGVGVHELAEPRAGDGRRGPHHAVDAVALGQQQLSEVAAVLPGDAGDERRLLHAAPPVSRRRRGAPPARPL